MASLHAKQHHLNVGNVNKGTMMAKENTKMDMAQDKAMVKSAIKQHDDQLHGGKKTTLKLAKGGSASARADGCATKGKTKGTMIAMCGGGMYKKGK
jgi:hypothetical protein